MSEQFNTGQHPDADQLSAFAERALPAHEQKQTLAHLAQCSRCRSIVYLAQKAEHEGPPEPEFAAQPTTARKPWFQGWTLAWSGATALACVVLGVVYVHHISVHKRAESTASLASNTSGPAAVPVLRATPQQPSPQPSPARVAHREAEAKQPLAISGIASGSAVALGKNIENNPISGQDISNSTPGQPETAAHANGNGAMAGAKAAPTIAGSGIGSGRGAGLSLVDGLSNGMAGSSASSSQQDAKASIPVASNSPVAADSAAQGQQFQDGAAPALQVRTTVAAQAANETKDIDKINAATLTTDALVEDAALLQKAVTLPSHLAAISTISNARMMLAIDSGGTLFFSKDAGKHWKSITPRWTGRAVKVDFASSMTRGKQNVPPVAETSALKAAPSPFGSMQGPLPQAAPAGNAALTGIVADRTGAVVSNATVAVINTLTSQTHTVKTDSTGRYAVDKLEPGVYRVEAQSPGFQAKEISGITVAELRPAVVNVALEVGAASEAVTVTAGAPALQTESAEIGETIDGGKRPNPHPAIFELTTNTGTVWTSTDGRHWKLE
jgi:hypothetical protein